MGFYGGILKAHNHTTAAGDGGQLNDLATTGTITETVAADIAAELPRYDQMRLWALLGV